MFRREDKCTQVNKLEVFQTLEDCAMQHFMQQNCLLLH